MPHFTAAQLAGQPGMPASPRGVHALAARQHWQHAMRRTRGGQIKAYAAASLPPATLAALRAASATEDPAITAEKNRLKSALNARANRAKKTQSLIDSHGLPAAQQRMVDARLGVLRALELYAQQHGVGMRQAEHDFADRYSHGRIALAPEVHEQISSVSAGTLQRWRQALRRDGVLALAPGYGGRRGQNKIDAQPALRDLIIAVMVRTPHVRTTHMMQILAARLAGVCELPSAATVRRWMAQWRADNHQTYTALTNPDRWKNTYMVAHGCASENITRLNELWELDSTPADVMLTDGRHSIIGVIDVYSRRITLHISKTSKASAVCLAVRRSLLSWGVPERAKTDNGQDYTSAHLCRVFAALDVEHELCPPFQGWRKPHIERFFGTFCRDLMELLDGYIGHNVAERREIEARKSFAERLMMRGEVVDVNMSAAELQQFCDDYIAHIYEHRSHSGLGGKTPFQMAAEWIGPVARIENERALDIMLAEAPQNNGRRTVQKKGIELDGAWFIAPELERYVREVVQVRFDPDDLGRIYVFGGPDLDFICIAECPERTGINREEAAAVSRAMQTKRVQDERAALKAAAKKINTDDIVGEIIRAQAEKNGKLAMFPQRASAHTSTGIRAAEDALAALDAPRLTTGDVMSADDFDARRAKLEAARNIAAQPVFETAFQRAYWIVQQSAERELSAEESQYLIDFKRGNPRGYADIRALISDRAGATFDAG